MTTTLRKLKDGKSIEEGRIILLQWYLAINQHLLMNMTDKETTIRDIAIMTFIRDVTDLKQEEIQVMLDAHLKARKE